MSELLGSTMTLTGINPDFEGWHKSTRSQTSNCVEVGAGPADVMGIRDSKDVEGPMLAVNRDTYLGFIAAVKSGVFGPEQ